MKKKLFMFATACLSLMMIFGLTAAGDDWTRVKIRNTSGNIPTRSEADMVVCYVQSGVGLTAVFYADYGYASVEVEDILTGVDHQTYDNTANGSIFVPMTETSGSFSVLISTTSGDTFEGEFVL